MAKHNTKTPNGLVTTWERLGSRELWSWKLFWFSALVFGALTFLMDFLRTANASWLWAITYVVSLGVALGLAAGVKTLILPKLPDQGLAWFNYSAAMLIGGIKNLVVAILANYLGLESEAGLLYRFIGGMILGTILISSFAAVTGARGAHSSTLRRLTKIQNELLGSKENLQLVLDEEFERLQQKSRDTVIPKLHQISELLGDDTKTAEVISELTSTVKNKVRPLMDEIAKTAKSSFTTIDDVSATKFRVSSPKYFVAREILRPFMYVAYTLPSVSVMVLYFQGPIGLLWGIMATLLFGVTVFLLSFALPKRETSRVFSYTLLTLVAVLAPVPSLYLLGGGLDFDKYQSSVVPLIAWSFFIMTATVLNPLTVLDFERAKLETMIKQENVLLEKEITIFEQRLWVFKKRWLFMLHGTVQSALTAALTRLQTFSESDPYQVSLVMADLERAEKALSSLPADEIDFEKSASELKEAWAGVCALGLEVDLRASRALATNKGSAYCVNEILKEAIGNAVRHGGANGVVAKITRDKDDFIDLEIQNDGSAPRKGWKKGIGSRMLDDITVSWSLTRSGQLTTLKARLPL
jgi:hypothetical protein